MQHNTILPDRESDLQVLFKHGENSELNRIFIFGANHAEFKEMSPSNCSILNTTSVDPYMAINQDLHEKPI